MDPLKPSKLSKKVLYVFFNSECTHDLENRDGSFEHISNLICAQKMRSKCGAMNDLSVDFNNVEIHVFWQDSVDKFIISGCADHSRTRFVISHNSWIRRTVSTLKVSKT